MSVFLLSWYSRSPSLLKCSSNAPHGPIHVRRVCAKFAFRSNALASSKNQITSPLLILSELDSEHLRIQLFWICTQVPPRHAMPTWFDNIKRFRSLRLDPAARLPIESLNLPNTMRMRLKLGYPPKSWILLWFPANTTPKKGVPSKKDTPICPTTASPTSAVLALARLRPTTSVRLPGRRLPRWCAKCRLHTGPAK